MPEKLWIKFTRFAGGLVVVTRVSTLVVGMGPVAFEVGGIASLRSE